MNVTPGEKGRVTSWLNWIEQPPPKGQVAGSNPAGVTIRIGSEILRSTSPRNE